MRFEIKIADHVVGIETQTPGIQEMCQDYLVPSGEASFVASVTEQEIKEQLDHIFALLMEMGRPATERYNLEFAEKVALYHKICDFLRQDSILMLHSSAILLEDGVYIFTAPSGTGKSTHARLWREVYGDKVIMLNDDKPLLRFMPDGIYAYGTPWNGKHRLGSNTRGKVRGICRLKQGETNEIHRISQKDAMSVLYTQAYKGTQPQEILQSLDMLHRLSTEIPCYEMECNMEHEAAVMSYETMVLGRKQEGEQK